MAMFSGGGNNEGQQQSGGSDYNKLARRLADQGPEAAAGFLTSLDQALQDEAGIGLLDLVQAWAADQEGQQQGQQQQGQEGPPMNPTSQPAGIDPAELQAAITGGGGRQKLSMR